MNKTLVAIFMFLWKIAKKGLRINDTVLLFAFKSIKLDKFSVVSG